MHIPDGFLSTEVARACAVPAAARVGVGLRRANVELDERRVPLLGVTAAFIFAAQMLNFPVAGGTSGHFLGAALAAILLGPWLACLVLAVVLGVQAFVFADGGITALGANVLNMGVVGALLVGGLMLAAQRVAAERRGALLAIAGAGAWLAVMAGATATRARARDLGHGPARHRPAGDARHPRPDRHRRGGHHRRRRQRRPVHPPRPSSGRCDPRAERLDEALHDPRPRARDRARHRRLAVRLQPPDGLERVAEDKAFLDARRRPVQEDAPVPDYAFPGVDDARARDRARRLRRHADRLRARLRHRPRRAAPAA